MATTPADSGDVATAEATAARMALAWRFNKHIRLHSICAMSAELKDPTASIKLSIWLTTFDWRGNRRQQGGTGFSSALKVAAVRTADDNVGEQLLTDELVAVDNNDGSYVLELECAPGVGLFALVLRLN